MTELQQAQLELEVLNRRQAQLDERLEEIKESEMKTKINKFKVLRDKLRTYMFVRGGMAGGVPGGVTRVEDISGQHYAIDKVDTTLEYAEGIIELQSSVIDKLLVGLGWTKFETVEGDDKEWMRKEEGNVLDENNYFTLNDVLALEAAKVMIMDESLDEITIDVQILHAIMEKPGIAVNGIVMDTHFPEETVSKSLRRVLAYNFVKREVSEFDKSRGPGHSLGFYTITAKGNGFLERAKCTTPVSNGLLKEDDIILKFLSIIKETEGLAYADIRHQSGITDDLKLTCTNAVMRMSAEDLVSIGVCEGMDHYFITEKGTAMLSKDENKVQVVTPDTPISNLELDLLIIQSIDNNTPRLFEDIISDLKTEPKCAAVIDIKVIESIIDMEKMGLIDIDGSADGRKFDQHYVTDRGRELFRKRGNMFDITAPK